jgi:hypothetical protein
MQSEHVARKMAFGFKLNLDIFFHLFYSNEEMEMLQSFFLFSSAALSAWERANNYFHEQLTGKTRDSETFEESLY